MDVTANIPTLPVKYWDETHHSRADGYRLLIPSIEMVKNRTFFKVSLEHGNQGFFYQPVHYDADYVRYYYRKETIKSNGKITVKYEDDELIEIINTESQRIENWFDIIREIRRRETLSKEEFWSQSGFHRQNLYKARQLTLQDDDSLGLKAMAPIVIYSYKKGHIDLVRIAAKLKPFTELANAFIATVN